MTIQGRTSRGNLLKYEKNQFVFVIFIAVIFAACSPAKKSTGVWVNTEKIQGKSFENIFIIVMTADIEARVQLENDLAAVATSKGYKVVKSYEAMPADLKNPKTPSKEEIVNKVKVSGCDAVFVSSVLKKEEGVRYTPGTTAYTVMPDYTYTGNYYGYYSHRQQTVSTPAYYSQDKTYFMQSNLYDVASEEIMWSVQSNVFKPSSLKSFSRSYTSSLISQLQKEKLLKEKTIK
jgi:hypothetical protein